MSSGRPKRLSGVRRTISSRIVVVFEHDLERARRDRADRDAVDPHLRREVGGHEPRHVAERALGRAVGDEPAVAQAADRGGDVDDRALVARVEQVRRRGLAEHERGRDVEVERPLEESGARVEERPRHRAARVVDDDVEPAELVDGLRDDVDDRVVVVDVASGSRAPAGRARGHRRRPRRAVPSCAPRARRRHPLPRTCGRSAAPMPRPAPVTIATLPSSRNASSPDVGAGVTTGTGETVSTIAAGFSAPSRSMVTRVIACTPPGTSLASITSPRPRSSRSDRDRCREAHLLGAVVDAHRDALDAHQLGEEVAGERHREVAVGDRRAERPRLAPARCRCGSTGCRAWRRRTCRSVPA